MEKAKLKHSLFYVKSECQILQKLDHPNIINYLDFFEDEENVYVVTEYVEGRNLFHLYWEQNKVMHENDAAQLMKALIKALIFWHSNNIIHRDVKLENIMLACTDDNIDYRNVKIIDFGVATDWVNKKEAYSTLVGTPYYMAPEVFDQNYDNKCDVWSAGVVLYILLSGTYPFEAESTPSLYELVNIKDVQFPHVRWKKISSTVKDLLKKMMQRNAKKRISLEEWLKHKWFIDNKKVIDERGSDDSGKLTDPEI